MSDNYLIPFESLELAPLDAPEIAELTKSSDFLPQLRVYGASNDIVKSGQFPMGHFGLYINADNVIDVGEQLDCLVVYARPRAAIVSNDTPASFYNYKSNEFNDIKTRSLNGEQGYLCGLEYLLWLPTVSRFALFFCGNKTLRRESEKVKALMCKAATLKVRYIKTAKYSWHGFSCFPCTTPFDLPDESDLRVELERFKNPPESQVELADTGGRER